MNEEEKLKIIKKLSDKKDSAFDSRYSEEKRKWFVRKTIDYQLTKSVPNSQMLDSGFAGRAHYTHRGGVIVPLNQRNSLRRLC